MEDLLTFQTFLDFIIPRKLTFEYLNFSSNIEQSGNFLNMLAFNEFIEMNRIQL